MDTSRGLHKCPCCHQKFGTRLELLAHSFTHSRWDKVKEEEEEEGTGGLNVTVSVRVTVKEEVPEGDAEFNEKEGDPVDCSEEVSQDIPIQHEPIGGPPNERCLDVPSQSTNVRAIVTEVNEGNTSPDNTQLRRSKRQLVSGLNSCKKKTRKKPCCCTRCGRVFKSKEGLGRHADANACRRKSLTCKVCRKKFPSHYRLHVHSAVHRDKPFTCKTCKKSFKYLDTLQSHEKVHEGRRKGRKALTCDVCNKTFTTPYLLALHRAVHSDSKPFNCYLCQKSFKYRNSLTEHQKTVHSGQRIIIEPIINALPAGTGSETDTPTSCHYCSKILHNEKDYINHITFYHERDNELAYACEMCSEKFKSLHRLNKHMKSSHNVNCDGHTCDHCGKIFANKSSLVRHISTHTGERRFKCSLCLKRLRTKRNLERHMLLLHSDKTNFICDQCGKGFKLKEYLKLHMETAHGKDKEKQRYVCKECPKSFSDNYNMQDHWRRVHKGEVRNYNCPECSNKYGHRSTLLTHRKRCHGHKTRGHKEHKCPICHRMFLSKSKFDIHVRLHTGERPFTCSICSEGFISTRHLSNHMKKHSPKKCFECNICSKTFSSHKSLKAHKCVHSESDEQQQLKCDWCGKVYKRFCYLKRHLPKCQGKKGKE